MKRTVVAGSLVLDILPVFPHAVTSDMLLAEGKVTECQGMRIYMGGEVGNTGLALHRLGEPVFLISKTGDDGAGFLIREMMKKEGVPSLIMETEGISSTASIALAVPGRDKSTIHSRGASQTFVADDIQGDLLKEADWFHLGYPTSMKTLYDRNGEEFIRMLKKVKQYGLGISVDMSLPDINTDAGKTNWLPILEKALPYIDIFMPSIEEAVFLFMHRTYQEMAAQYRGRDMTEVLGEEFILTIADRALEMGTKAVLLKCGKRGMVLKTGEHCPWGEAWNGRELWCTPYKPEKIRSATGAGDTAIAGFLNSFKRGCTPEKALDMAAFTALRCLESYDTVSRIGTYQEMEAIKKEGGERLNGPDSSEWTYCMESGCYVGKNDRRKVR